MKIRWLVLMILGVFGVGMVSSVLVIKQKNLSEVDVVAMNEVVKIAEKNWGQVTKDIFIQTDVEEPFSIIDLKGHVIYQTQEANFIDEYEAIKHRDTIMDVRQNDKIVGKVIFHNNEREMIRQLKKELTILIILVFSVIMIIMILYMIYLYRTLLKPFQQLQAFAGHVARGHLDVPLHMKKNNYFGAFTESFDLMREELAAAKQREYETNRSKKELVATLSHDIQTPIASIKAVSELMLLQAKDEKVIKQVNTIHAKAEQVHLLVTDMFHATLEELQQLTITATEESSEILIDMIENVNFDEKIVCESIPSCILIMDPVRMQQVLDNIISNSYKYAGTKVTITSEINQGFLELHIQDFGPGISESELPLLFHKYYRGNNVEGKKGSGLGLYISKYFMEHMEGQIHCFNRPDGFTVMLKIKLA